jgi:serine/threonine protein kinase
VSAPGRDLLKQMLERDPAKRVRAADALRHPWLQDADSASALPLRSSVVQRLQRFATYGHLKQLVLRLIADDMATHPTTQKESQVGGQGGWVGAVGGGKLGACASEQGQCLHNPACTPLALHCSQHTCAHHPNPHCPLPVTSHCPLSLPLPPRRS